MPSLNDLATSLHRLAAEVENAFTEMNRAGQNDSICVLAALPNDRFEIVANTSGARQRLMDTMLARSVEHQANIDHMREVLANIELDRTPEDLAEVISASAANATLNLEGNTGNVNGASALTTTIHRMRVDASTLQSTVMAQRSSRHSREEMYTMLDEILRDDSMVGEAKVGLLQQAVNAARLGQNLIEADNPLLYLTQQLLISLMGEHR